MTGRSTLLRLRPLLLVPALACGGSRPDEGADLVNDSMAESETDTVNTNDFVTLFDGTSLDAWRGYQREDVPPGWTIEGDVLAFTPGAGGADLVTREEFSDFDLRLEWRVSPGGNSGIFYRTAETTRWPYQTGPEMQILDDDGHADGQAPVTSAGSNYGLHAPSEDVTRPAGEWNEARILVAGNRVQHWLNGVRIVEYELGSAAWNALVSASKFAEWPEYGRHSSGRIGLQDHGDPVWFRNIRIRRLDAPDEGDELS